MIIKFIFFLIHFMLGVGFFIFLERKFLGLSHYREGPNKVLIKGYFQFFFDMLKLFNKIYFELFNLILYIYLFLPLVLFLNMLVM